MRAARALVPGDFRVVSVASLALVIVHYGPEEACSVCLESARCSTGVQARALVVDHNPEASARIAALTRAMGGVYHHEPANPGFAAGANSGIRLALESGDFEAVGILNADIRLEPSCLLKLCEALRSDASIGLAGPGLLWSSRPDRWWNAGSEIRWPSGRPVSLRHGERVNGEPRRLDVGFVAGAALWISRRALQALGGLEECYFLYFEDADLAFRARALGFRVVVEPSARAWHEGGGSTVGLDAAIAYYRTRNRLEFSRRWNPHPVRGRFARGVFAARQASRSIARFALTGRRDSLAPAAGALDYFRGRLGRRRDDLPRGAPGSSAPG